jgi:hypothetical protein
MLFVCLFCSAFLVQKLPQLFGQFGVVHDLGEFCLRELAQIKQRFRVLANRVDVVRVHARQFAKHVTAIDILDDCALAVLMHQHQHAICLGLLTAVEYLLEQALICRL